MKIQHHIFTLCAFLWLSFGIAMMAQAQSVATVKGENTERKTIVLPPEKLSPASVPRFEAAPVIDGKLDDDIWKSAAVFKDFYQTEPGDNIAPSRPTEVFLGYDSKF